MSLLVLISGALALLHERNPLRLRVTTRKLNVEVEASRAPEARSGELAGRYLKVLDVARVEHQRLLRDCHRRSENEPTVLLLAYCTSRNRPVQVGEAEVYRNQTAEDFVC